MLRVHRQFIVLRYTASDADSGKRRRAETLYGVARKRADLLRMSLVTTAAMLLAICLLALVETANTAQAEDSLPENGKIAFESFPPGRGGRIYTVEPDGSNVRQLSPLDGIPKWSPDGTEILFNGSMSFIGAMRADGSNYRGITNASGDAVTGNSATWSADGKSVAFTNNHLDIEKGQSQDDDIFMVDLDNSVKTTLRRTPQVSEQFADFSPDGSQVCFTHFDTLVAPELNKPSGIYVMDVHGSLPTLLFEDDSPGTCDWRPDGKKIVFNSKSDYPNTRKAEVYIINADGSGRTALTSNSASDVDPAWSPDGTKIVFSSDRDGGDFDLYTMDVDGSDVAQVTNSPGEETQPDWQPLTPKSRSLTVHQPDTGGPSLLLVASVLLISGGVMFYAGLKRRM